MLTKTKGAAAAVTAAALVMAGPTMSPVDAHHRDGDRWERRDDHHHGPWIYKKDSRLAQHRRWHARREDNGKDTSRKHPASPALRVHSTAYCLSGRMANGQYAHRGAAAMNGVPLGTRFRVMTGPLRGKILTVKDRVGHGSEFDVAMPNNCSSARRYGRRTVNLRRVT